MNCFDSKIESGIIGFALRRSSTTNAISRATPGTAEIATVAALRPSDALISANVAAASPVAARTAPGMSSRPVAVGSRVSGTWRFDMKTTKAPRGRLIRKIHRHDTASTR